MQSAKIGHLAKAECSAFRYSPYQLLVNCSLFPFPCSLLPDFIGKAENTLNPHLSRGHFVHEEA